MALTNVDGTPKVIDKKQETVTPQLPKDGTLKTYTQEELDKYANDAKAAQGRELKTATETMNTMAEQIKSLVAQDKTRQATLDALELDRVKNDPAAMSAYRARKEAQDKADILAAKEADLAKREAAIATKEGGVQKAERVALEASYVALGLSPDLIKGLDSLTNEHFVTVCKTLTVGKKIEPLKKVDSGISVGGNNGTGLTPADKIARGLAALNT